MSNQNYLLYMYYTKKTMFFISSFVSFYLGLLACHHCATPPPLFHVSSLHLFLVHFHNTSTSTSSSLLPLSNHHAFRSFTPFSHPPPIEILLVPFSTTTPLLLFLPLFSGPPTHWVTNHHGCRKMENTKRRR